MITHFLFKPQIIVFSWGLGVTAISLLQEGLPNGLEPILTQLPFVAVLIWLFGAFQRWHNQNEDRWERRLQREQDSCKEFISKTADSFKESLQRMDARSTKYAENIQELTKQLTIISATVNEAAKIDELLDRLIQGINK